MQREEVEHLFLDFFAKKKVELIPVGTIVSSVLSFDKFKLEVKDKELWNKETSMWSPADGRKIAGSRYAEILFAAEPNQEKIRVPDLRGVFIRGLNNFDINYNVAPSFPDQLDPDNDVNNEVRVGGSLQYDAIKNHVHPYYDKGTIHTGDWGASEAGNYNGGETRNTQPQLKGNDHETRPKNVAVFYYIKIN